MSEKDLFCQLFLQGKSMVPMEADKCYNQIK